MSSRELWRFVPPARDLGASGHGLFSAHRGGPNAAREYRRWAPPRRLVVLAAGLIVISTTNVKAAPLVVSNATFSADTILGAFEPVPDIVGPSFVGVHLSNNQQEVIDGLPGTALGSADADTVPGSNLAAARAEVRATNDFGKADAVVKFSFDVVRKRPGGVPAPTVPLDIGGVLFTHVEAFFPTSSFRPFVSVAVASAGIEVGEVTNSVGDQVRSQCVNDPTFMCDPDVSEQFKGTLNVTQIRNSRLR
jgi:hypothetical protein